MHGQQNITILCYGNPRTGSRLVPCGQNHMTKLIVAFRDFANVPKTVCVSVHG